MRPRAPLPLPPFFDPLHSEQAGYDPDPQRLYHEAAGWRRAHRIGPAAGDRHDVHLLLVDEQRDFCFPSGALYVAGRSGRGALDDLRRTAELIYRNLDLLTRITTTLDTHFAFQIFFPSFWVDAQGEPLRPHREITIDDLDRGAVRPNPAMARWLGEDEGWLRAQVRFYCAELARAGKYRLYLWPPHCLLGSSGHALAGVIHEARLFHSFVRYAQSWVEVKGGHPLTENYSVLRPEVLRRHDGTPLAAPNDAFLRSLLAADAVIIAGQAASHCVKSSVEDLLDEIAARDRALAHRVYLVTDCMSAVTVPDGRGGFAADFTPEVEAAFARFVEAGVHLVRSTDPIDAWPEIRLGWHSGPR